MNKKRIQPRRSRSLPILLMMVLLAAAGIFSAGCLTLPPVETTPTQTLMPAPPVVTGTTMALAAAYPPPVSPYPGAAETPVVETPSAYPNNPTPIPAISSPFADTPPLDLTATPDEFYFPMIAEGHEPTAAPSEVPAATVTPLPSPTVAAAIAPVATPIHVVDFAAVRDELAGQGLQLAYNKIGFHVTFLEDREELDFYMERLDAEGVPFFLKSVDNAEPIYKAQELMKRSGVPHTLVYRSTLYDVPDYDMDPVLAAESYWELEKSIWPPELDPGMVWFETMNELDKNRSEWLAQFSLRTAELALRDGYKWAAFGWSSGEPEPEDWESPAMLELLRLIGDNPDRLAIALHEYSYLADDIGHEYPHKIGRFLNLFAAADKHGIPRPTVLITEWGWTYNDIPAEPLAMEDVAWAAQLYGAYPEVLGAAIWNLGKLDDKLLPLNTQMQDLIDNMLAISLDSYFNAPAPPARAPLDPSQFPPPAN